MNPSLANRLRIGFAITFALLAGMTVVGVGRLFQLRQDFEDSTSRSFQREVAGEHLRQAFLIEQAALRGADTDRAHGPGALRRGAARPRDRAAAGRAPALGRRRRAPTPLLNQRQRRERSWRNDASPSRSSPAGRHRSPSSARLAQQVIRPATRLIAREGRRRTELRDDVASDTRQTALLVGAGLISGPDRRDPALRRADRLDAAAAGAPRRRRRQAGRAATCGRGSRSADRPRPRRSASPSTRWPTSCRAPIDRRRGEPAAPRGDAGEPLRRRDHRRRDRASSRTPTPPRGGWCPRRRPAPRSARCSANGSRGGARSSACWPGASSEELHVGEGESTLAITGSPLGAQERRHGPLGPRHLRARPPGADEGRVRPHRVA